MNNTVEKIKEMIASLGKISPKQKAILAATVAGLSVAGYTAYRALDKVETNEVFVEDITQLDEQGSNEQSHRSVASEDPHEQCKATTLPSFINVSLTWSGSLFGETLQSLSPPSVIVVAAGNKHPKPIRSEKVKASQDFDAIIVGSLAPDGKRSHFSHEHEEMHIMAPADYYQSSADAEGNRRNFGGTSGATPLVTGSLAGFEWLSGYHPTAEESKILLEKTAIMTQHSHDNPRKNGAGIVNAYKLGMVGKKLKELCGTNMYCFKNKIREASTYNFPEDEDVISVVEQVFPECSSDNCNVEFSICADKALAFKRLRKAALLNPSNKKLWKYIACAYNSSGFTKNGEGIMNIYKPLFGPIKDNKEAYTFCRTNADCTLIPASVCGVTPADQNVPVLARTLAGAEIYYAEQHCTSRPLCNDKCRCADQETINFVKADLKTNVFSSSCINSQCVLNSETIDDLSDQEDTSSSGSSSGQR